MEDNFWKSDWELTRKRYEAWWRHEGLVFRISSPAEVPRLQGPSLEPVQGWWSGIDANYPLTGQEPVDLNTAWLDPDRRARLAELHLASTYFGGESFPYFDTHIGPGSLGMFLGAGSEFESDTVWYHACITDPDSHPPLQFDPQADWFLKHLAIIEAGLERSQGRYLVGMPDLIENLDTLSALRGVEEILLDLILRPEWVHQRIAEVNTAFFAAFDHLFDLIKDPWGGNTVSAFHIWGPGKTAKIQSDMSLMISPKMFGDFVVPALTEQCEWLDYSMYHLDGTGAIMHLDQVLEIESLDAVQWTPQAGIPNGGDPMWYDLYRRILDAGKSVQAVFVNPDEVIPLLNAIGTHGVYIMSFVETEAEVRALVKSVEAYRK